MVPLHCTPMARGKQLFCKSQQTPCVSGHGFCGAHGPVAIVHPVGQGTTVTHAPLCGSQQTIGWHGLGEQDVVVVMTMPLHGVPATQGMQFPRLSQHTPANCGTGHSVGVQGPTAWVEPAGQGWTVWHAPVCGSQHTLGGHGFGWHGPPKNVPLQAVTEEIAQLPAASQHAPGHGLGLQVTPAPRNWPWHCAAVALSEQLPARSQHAPGHGLGWQEVWPVGAPPWCEQKVRSTKKHAEPQQQATWPGGHPATGQDCPGAKPPGMAEQVEAMVTLHPVLVQQAPKL